MEWDRWFLVRQRKRNIIRQFEIKMKLLLNFFSKHRNKQMGARIQLTLSRLFNLKYARRSAIFILTIWQNQLKLPRMWRYNIKNPIEPWG